MGLCDEFKHTRGPWHLEGELEEDSDTGQTGETHLTVWGDDLAIGSIGGDYGIIETQANADLIAAAPDMLAALCDWYDAMNEGFGSAGGRTLFAATEKVIGKAKDWD